MGSEVVADKQLTDDAIYCAHLAAELKKAAAIYENETLYTGDGHPRTFAILADLLRRSAEALSPTERTENK